MIPAKPDTEDLLRQAEHGDRGARDGLLARHRDRLRKMIAWRLDRRLAARVDPSDVVQEVLVEASRKLDRYLRERPLPFFPWLRALAGEHLATLHRRHVRARGRSVLREEPGLLNLPDESAAELAARLASMSSSPTRRALQREQRERVRQALDRLSDRDREVLVLRNLEQLSVADTAEVLRISAGAVKVRHLRALERLRALLAEQDEEDVP
ncbi:MAG TPA: sigma-70 family RNA polymerase sigma factor [Gemmataceae bacterium]|nr:sigma-70 family RNA polymerase sigma factor [Gemmataceae bacterium]